MTPRKRLVSVGYTFRAYNADKVDGKDASAFVEAGQANAITTPMIQDNAVTVAKIAPNIVSSLSGVSNDGGNIDLVAGSNITITPDDANNKITIAATGTGGGIGGSGTANYLPKFTGATTIGNSVVYESNGNIGVSTTNPLAKLHVANGELRLDKADGWVLQHVSEGNDNPGVGLIGFNNTTASKSAAFRFTKNYALAIDTWDTSWKERMRISNNGNVGIGTTSPTQKLDVAGTVQMTGFKLPTGATNNYVLTSDASGVGVWKPISPMPDNDWTISGNNMYSAVSGNVGIGVTNPTFKLEVDGSAQITSKGDDATILMLNCERPFAFHQRGIGSAAGLDLRPNVDAKLISISASDKKILGGFYDDAGTNPDKVYFVPENGNVGIGTTIPTHKLHVVAQDAVGLFESSSNLAYLRLSTNEGLNNRVELKNNPGGRLSLWTAGGSDVFNITRDGKVGIGTINPTAKFHLVSEYAIFEGTSASVPNCPEIQFRETNSKSYWIMSKRGSAWSPEQNQLLFSFYDGSNWFQSMNLKTNKDVLFHGNVGIGVTNPGYRLDVDGGAQITAKGDDATILMLNCERPFAFHQRGTGSAAGLDLRPNVEAKLISISASDKKILAGFFDETSPTIDKVYFVPDGGYVGVGLATPNRIFQIKQGAGRAIADGWDVYSSRRWKTNIQPIQGALDKVKRLTGVLFDWKDSGKHDLGLIAEEVGQVIPEVVTYEENGVDAQSVDYARLVAILIQGMKEQQMTIEQLTKRIDELEKKK